MLSLANIIVGLLLCIKYSGIHVEMNTTEGLLKEGSGGEGVDVDVDVDGTLSFLLELYSADGFSRVFICHLPLIQFPLQGRFFDDHFKY